MSEERKSSQLSQYSYGGYRTALNLNKLDGAFARSNSEIDPAEFFKSEASRKAQPESAVDNEEILSNPPDVEDRKGVQSAGGDEQKEKRGKVAEVLDILAGRLEPAGAKEPEAGSES